MGVLPFMLTADVLDEDRSVLLAEVPCSIWPAQAQRSSRTGVEHDHRGEAPRRFQGFDIAALLEVANRSLYVADGPRAGTYRVTGAVEHDMLPHVALELRRVGA